MDGQSAVRHYFENSIPLCRAARGIHRALEGGASCLDGAIINCMGMAMENILARPSSALSRGSDDFVPARENGFGEHLLQNAYNALYQGQLYHCDWDMFWTSHEDAAKHSLLRAISDGPVYFSDKIGETDPDVLKPLACLDGRILMMDRPARPAEDCVFADPMREGVLKLTNTADCGGKKAGGIAVFNLTDVSREYSFSPGDVPKLPDVGRYLGLSEKYAGFAAVENMYITQRGMGCVITEQGPVRFVCAHKPAKVLCSGIEMTHLLKEENSSSHLGTYVANLKPEKEKAVLEVLWDCQ